MRETLGCAVDEGEPGALETFEHIDNGDSEGRDFVDGLHSVPDAAKVEAIKRPLGKVERCHGRYQRARG